MQKTPLSVDACLACEEGHPPVLSAASGRTAWVLMVVINNWCLLRSCWHAAIASPARGPQLTLPPAGAFLGGCAGSARMYCSSLNQISELTQSQKDKTCFRGIFTVGWASL